MAEKKISDLTPKTGINDTDEFVFVDKATTSGEDASTTGQTSKIAFSDLKTAVGTSGPQGSQGADGMRGERGENGQDGNQGNPGKDGNQGFQGNPGFQGRQGNQGFQGKQGNQGFTGVGQQGFQGRQGNQGFKGDQGSSGSPWSGGTFTGQVDVSGHLNVNSGYQKIHSPAKSAYLDFKTSDTTTNVDSRWFRMDLQSSLERLSMHMVNSSGTSVGAGLLITRSGTSGVINEDAGQRGGQAVYPTGNGQCQLGSAFQRWKQVYAVSSAISTSDERLKQDINDLTVAEQKVATKLKNLVKTYRYRDSVENKGENARIHCGIIAQDVAKAFESEGLDPHRYSLFCKDEAYQQEQEDGNPTYHSEDADGRTYVEIYSIKYEELLAFIISAI